jgi:hypothetical protein
MVIAVFPTVDGNFRYAVKLAEAALHDDALEVEIRTLALDRGRAAILA